jgi:hypothetical protein
VPCKLPGGQQPGRQQTLAAAQIEDAGVARDQPALQ